MHGPHRRSPQENLTDRLHQTKILPRKQFGKVKPTIGTEQDNEPAPADLRTEGLGPAIIHHRRPSKQSS
jgi:hypothetical protein